jgi:hypothetical protein
VCPRGFVIASSCVKPQRNIFPPSFPAEGRGRRRVILTLTTKNCYEPEYMVWAGCWVLSGEILHAPSKSSGHFQMQTCRCLLQITKRSKEDCKEGGSKEVRAIWTQCKHWWQCTSRLVRSLSHVMRCEA